MVRFSSAAGVALALATSTRAHTVPLSHGMSQLSQRDLAKTPLLDNFDALTADPSRIPPIVKGTATKWDAGRYPQNCYDKAREAISDDDARPKCQLGDLEIYDVTYEDCPSGRDPWVLCRCANAELSLQDTIDGSPQKTWFSHESMHCNDRDGFAFSNGDVFNNAINADSCVPDGYANNNPTEDFAQVGTYLNYDINGHAIDYTGKDASCMNNQLNAARDYLAERLDKNGACFNAPGTDGIANGKRSTSIVERDPNSSYEKLLPHTPYAHGEFF
ncbi:uncharacterized protein N0V89_003879 [Didymosphaeria variabile]|uniref:Deuterolysin n=1 Tax=Didymosphaeria variabile TaxID=1932322 RepID=A0A9W8XNG2_9PLEO|nr:uncharacterized protein N0V89_003879 [Didymosphaeria variabile]KAJ4355858.1 hypothetical protein N0V89_003879 [Didymosphaeria variabile]